MSKRFAPATERNRTPLLTVLESQLPEAGTILEVAAGTGQHAAFFAPRLAPRWWLPTDLDEANIASIAAWREEVDASNLLPPQPLDVLAPRWSVEASVLPEPISAIVNINMVHISPWSCCEALFDGAARMLKPQAPILMYGPFKRGDEHTAPSNAAFDKQLRAQDPHWGVRNLDDVIDVAEARGFSLGVVVEMPANNLMVSFVRA